jgi:hypothetical protein
MRTFAELFNSGQFALLVAFATVGMLFVSRRSPWKDERKAEFYLAGWLAVGLGVFLATVRITFPQYFILLIPFLCILTSVGLLSVGSWLRSSGRPAWFAAGVLALYCAGLPWWLWQQKQRPNWARLEQVANVVNQVTPKDGLVLADEDIYFAARRDPPSGLEFSASQLLQLPPAYAAKLNITSRAEVYDLLAKGRIATVATCSATEAWMDSTGIRKIFSERARLNGCDVFWSKAAD